MMKAETMNIKKYLEKENIKITSLTGNDIALASKKINCEKKWILCSLKSLRVIQGL